MLTLTSIGAVVLAVPSLEQVDFPPTKLRQHRSQAKPFLLFGSERCFDPPLL
jgi:hypothetical protein